MRARLGLSRRTFLAWGLGAGLCARTAHAQETTLPRPDSLPDAARMASQKGQPLVVLVSLPGCPFCEQVRRSHLLPMLRERGHGVVQLDIGSAVLVTDFDGHRRSQDAVIRAWKATFTPTVLLLDSRGLEIADRLVGAGVADFYGAYLDERLQAARQVMSRRTAQP